MELEKSQVDVLKDTVRRLYSTSQNSFSDASEEEQDFLRQFSFICMLSFDVYLKKQMIERLIDQLPAPDFLKKNKSRTVRVF